MDNCIVLRMAEGRSGTLTPSAYNKFLTNRARGLLFRDKKHKKPYAFTSSKAEYRSLIHDAVMGLINECKSFLTGEEFVSLCGRVAAYHAAR